jgi:hypothetical protein
VAKLYWSDRAREAAAALPERAQRELRRLNSLVMRWPEMYQEVTEPPRWHGHRKFLVRGRWLVFYRVKKGTSPDDDQVYIVDIVPAQSNY